MTTNNPYSRSFKTKREEYEEKLKQRNENEEWIFGNKFGRPGAGAPLRDKNGNVISSLKSVSNLGSLEPQYFSKGDNNISVINNKIYERVNGNVNEVISDPFTPFRNYINQFDPNSTNASNMSNTNSINNNANNININNKNNLYQNQMQINPQQLNNLNYQNNQLNNEEQKRELYLNQFRQNPYLIQNPLGITTQYPMNYPILPLYGQNQNSLNNNKNLILNNNSQVENQRPFSSISQINNSNINNNANYNINNNINNIDFNDITGNSNSSKRKYVRKLPESTLDFDQEKVKKDKERKMEEWKKDLLVQINEKKKREAEEKRLLKEREEKDKIENDKYQEFKEKQKNEMLQKKKNMQKRRQSEIEASGSGSMGNTLDISNDANKSMHSQNNLISKGINPNQNNIQEQENVNLNNNEYNNYNNNKIMEQNQNIYNQEEDNLKSYINRQYHLLHDTLNHDINNEMKRITEEVDKNYAPFTKKFLLMNTNSKTMTELSQENEKKIKKIQDLIEDKKLVDYILGKRERPPTPKEEKDSDQIELPVPSYFGINRDKAENKYLGLHSNSSFIPKNGNIAEFIASGRNQEGDNNNNLGNNLLEKQNINKKFNDYMNDDMDGNLNYNIKLNTEKATFGTNIRNDEALGGAINFSKNLDNTSIFIPLNRNRENINLSNDQKLKYVPGIENTFSNNRDKDMDDLLKELDEIYDLTNKIDVTSKARIIKGKYDGDLNKNINKAKDINSIKEEQSNSSINNLSNNNNIQNNNNEIYRDKISELKSSYSNNKTNTNNNNLTNRQQSETNSNNNFYDKINVNNNTNELYSNDGKISNSQNNNEEKELTNSQNFNEDINNGNSNVNNEEIDNNQNIENNNQNNVIQKNENEKNLNLDMDNQEGEEEGDEEEEENAEGDDEEQ